MLILIERSDHGQLTDQISIVFLTLVGAIISLLLFETDRNTQMSVPTQRN